MRCDESSKQLIDTSASKGWFVWFRFYAPTEPFFNQTWQLPDFEKVK